MLTHRAKPTVVKEGGTTFTFVTGGLADAPTQAKAAAGDKDVMVAGGANAVQQLMEAGELDELYIHLIPILLGKGTRLFDNLTGRRIELESTGAIAGSGVTHLKFRLVK